MTKCRNMLGVTAHVECPVHVNPSDEFAVLKAATSLTEFEKRETLSSRHWTVHSSGPTDREIRVSPDRILSRTRRNLEYQLSTAE
jgi:hypothetical protein